MSRLVKSYLTSVSGEHLLRIHPVHTSEPVPSPPAAQPGESLVWQAQEKARQILLHAEEEAAGRLEDIKQIEEQRRAELAEQAAAVLQQAQQEGQQRGYLEGYEAGQKEAFSQIQSAKEILHAAIRARDEFLAGSEAFLLTIAMAIARKIVRSELSLRPDAVLETVRACLLELQGKGLVELRVNPDDYQMVQSRIHELVQAVTGSCEVLVIPEASITQGGCMAFTEHSSIDARMETGFDEIRKAIQEICGGAGL